MVDIGHCIYITRDLEHLSHRMQAKAALKGGIKHIQFRTKALSTENAIEEALHIRSICTDYDAFFTVNDSPDVAVESKADAVHLGIQDLAIPEVRLEYPTLIQIGGTCNTLADVMDRIHDGANYVGLGPFQFTTTKQHLNPILGLNGYTSILSQLKVFQKHIPIFAIGGIGLSDIQSLLQLGIQGVALSSSLGDKTEDIQLNAKHLMQQIHTFFQKD